QIKDVFPLSLQGPHDSLQQGWVVEADMSSSPDSFDLRYVYYLLTPNLEKELADATSTVSDSSSGSCTLDNVKVIHSSDGDYLILSSKQCFGYGTVGYGSVAIYKLPSGEKIKFQGSLTVPGEPASW